MKLKKGYFLLIVFILIIYVQSIPLSANDASAGIATGGIILKKEARISMEKERLTIALNKITVEYEFLNQSDTDITTIVAFPIPGYSPFTEEFYRGIPDFKLMIEGIPVKYQTETSALNKDGQEYTKLLKELNIPVEGKIVSSEFGDQVVELFKKIPENKRKPLYTAGMFEKDENGDSWPCWTVRKTHYWEQKFPAHKIVKIRHEYTPDVGFKFLGYEDQDIYKNSCATPGMIARLKKFDPGTAHAYWVNYILTTANTWKTPIKEFELIVEKSVLPKYLGDSDTLPKFLYVSFCWDDQVVKLDELRFRAIVKDFIPKSDLTVYYFAKE